MADTFIRRDRRLPKERAANSDKAQEVLELQEDAHPSQWWNGYGTGRDPMDDQKYFEFSKNELPGMRLSHSSQSIHDIERNIREGAFRRLLNKRIPQHER